MALELALFLANIAFVCSFEVISQLPDQYKPDYDACIEKAQELPIDTQWEAQLACLSALYTKLPSDNMTDDDWSIFLEAERNRFGLIPPASGFRVRKEVRTLTEKEWFDVANVFNVMYKQGTLRKFGRLHGLATESAHKGAAFLVWHRVFLVHFEEEMRKINPSVSLPYWDYSLDNNITKPTESVVWSDCFFGNNDGIIKSGPFKFFYGAHGGFIARNADRSCETILINKVDMDNVKQHCDYKEITTGTEDYMSNTHNLELLHDGVHDWIGGDMGVVQNSAFDPTFWMHHAFIDYIFEEFRKKQQTKECDCIDIESNYRPLNNLCRACTDGTTHGHGPADPMWGYRHLRNIDGLWLNWTTAFYSYDPAPSCPDWCSGKYLYCDKNADENHPEGLCLTRKTDACVLTSNRLHWATENKPILEPRMSCYSGTKLKGLRGDGRTRDMTEKQANQILHRPKGKPHSTRRKTKSFNTELWFPVLQGPLRYLH